MSVRFVRFESVSTGIVLIAVLSLFFSARTDVVLAADDEPSSGADAQTTEDQPRICMRPGPQPDSVVVVTVMGFSRNQRTALQKADWKRERWKKVLAVYTGNGNIADRPAMLGRYAFRDNVLRFTPQFPLQPGVTYKAVLVPARIGNAKAPLETRIVEEFTIPETPPGEPTVVEEIYPSAKTLPENNLKFYLHFSAPMSQGESYRYIRLHKASAEEVDYPFLKLGQELWDDSGTRLTVFIDPGRIKQGLKPREEEGPVLEKGNSYTLRIGGDWPDATGYPLKTSFHKTFQVGPSDSTQPDPHTWTITPPAAGTSKPLRVAFGEPLDHAMLGRVLHVVDSEGEPLTGRITIRKQETQWRFHPDKPWTAGRYELVVETTLEDRAGNSIARPFEVDVLKPITRRITTETVAIEFEVAPQ